MFGYTEEQVAWFGLTFGVSAFMLYMVFIIFQLARESRAGKLGTFVLFLAIFGGLALYGAAGIVLGPLLLRLGVEALDIARDEGLTAPSDSADEPLALPSGSPERALKPQT